MDKHETSQIEDYVPTIRPVELMPLQIEGETVVAIQDPLHMVDEVVTLTPIGGLIASLFDGNHTIKQISEILEKRLQQKVPYEVIYQLVQELDEHYFMATENFVQYQQRLVENFRNEPRRPAYLADKSYPADPDILRSLIDSFYKAEEGPGLPPAEPSSSASARAIVAPHIDLRKGGPCFAHAYHALAECEPADTYVILGTGHVATEGMFVCTDKIFETPFGAVETDSDFLQRLNNDYGGELFAEEILHRTEHVIEFQLLFLQHLFGEDRDFKIVPILCSYSPMMTLPDASPQYAPRIHDFSRALKRTIEESNRRVCIVASVDLAHLGPRYGDREALKPRELKELERKDRKLLDVAVHGSPEAFNQHFLQDDNDRRICGYACLNTMLNAGDFSNGEVLHYDQTQVDEEGSVVSFTSMIYR